MKPLFPRFNTSLKVATFLHMKLNFKRLAAEKATINLANRGWIFGLKIELTEINYQ
jgi:hypothetical protein